MLAPQRNCCILLLLLLVVVGNMSTPVPEGKDKVRPFRRAEEVQEFCQSDGHSLRCYKAEGVVDPQQCPVNFTSCACSNETRSRRDVDSSDVAAVAPTEDDSCQCASDNKSVAPCEACSASATAVTTTAVDLKTTILTLQLYIYYVWAYLKRRAPCVHADEERATNKAIEMLQLRLDEIYPSRVLNALDPRQKLCGTDIGPYDQAKSKVKNRLYFLRIYHTTMQWHYRRPSSLGTVCNNLVNNHITNKAKRLKEVSNAMQHLKTLLEAYSCVTRGIADSDNLCCYLSRCEVAPRTKQCLDILNATALHNIAEDVPTDLPNSNFIQFIGNGFGASFDCRMPSSLD